MADVAASPEPRANASADASASTPSSTAATDATRRGRKIARRDAAPSPGGHYADPRSPISSTPLKRARLQKPSPSPAASAAATAAENDDARAVPRSLESAYDEQPSDEKRDEKPPQDGELFSPALRPPRAAAKSSSSNPSPSNSSSHAKQDASLLSSSSTCSEHNDDDDDGDDDDGANEDAVGAAAFPSQHRDSDGGSGGNDHEEAEEEAEEEENVYSGNSDSASETSASDQEFNPFYFMKTLPKYDEIVLSPRPIALPAKARTAPKICLVLDLDETLVHCSVDDVESPHLQFPVNFNGVEYTVKVKKRPHMEYFLKRVSKLFEVVVFTASHRAYAETLLNLLDPHRNLIKYRLYRDDCLDVFGNYLKDLNVLGRDLSKVLLVDNSPHAFGYQVGNGVPIETWYDDEGDDELLNLLPFLESLVDADDVRPIVEQQFQIQKLIDATPDEVV